MREGVISYSLWRESSPLSLWERVATHEVRRRVRGILPPCELCKEVLQEGRGLLQDVVVPVAGYRETCRGNCGVPNCITLRFRVLTSVDLDLETLIEADEVENVVLDWHLPTKKKGKKPTIPQ